jgi:hypothetical protein
MAATTIPRQASDHEMLKLQAAFAVLVVAVVALPFAMTALDVERSAAPQWLPAVIVVATGIFSIVAVFFQRIRPVAPGSVRAYRRVVGKRAWYSVLPAVFGAILYVASGHWSAILLGAVLSLPGLLFSLPRQDDFIRHQEIWNERLPLPPSRVWGTAKADDIPPWEDPDGGHGHGFGPHGLH